MVVCLSRPSLPPSLRRLRARANSYLLTCRSLTRTSLSLSSHHLPHRWRARYRPSVWHHTASRDPTTRDSPLFARKGRGPKREEQRRQHAATFVEVARSGHCAAQTRRKPGRDEQGGSGSVLRNKFINTLLIHFLITQLSFSRPVSHPPCSRTWTRSSR